MAQHASLEPLVKHCIGSNMPGLSTPPHFLSVSFLPTLFALQVSEDRLIELLEQVNEQTQQKTTVTIQRRRAFDDDF